MSELTRIYFPFQRCSYGGLSTQIAAQRLIADKVEVMVVYVGTDESCKAKILVSRFFLC